MATSLTWNKDNTDLIYEMACAYVSHKNATLRSIAKEYGISYRKVQRSFAKDLLDISPILFEKVNAKKVANRAKNQYKRKDGIITKIKKVFRKK